eukprot:gnl/Carplike_NY0171/3207_a4314_289.p1 GENE.gnl/Carplike_NY0171/3207_a4314_289~~gnl/Carplike_NY0171/3207_a4314_289.p1  ORF type:complete len:547 (-),score=114.89 gnl/Carplike_NY0171/3207_a4314_289:31-1479(-)
MREQIRSWISASAVVDLSPLENAKLRIESEMERFKVYEKQSKRKAFSNASLEQGISESYQAQTSKAEARAWMRKIIGTLQERVSKLEKEQEDMRSRSKRGGGASRMEALSEKVEEYSFHISKLELISIGLDKEWVLAEDLNEVRETLDEYIEGCDSVVDNMGELREWLYEEIEEIMKERGSGGTESMVRSIHDGTIVEEESLAMSVKLTPKKQRASSKDSRKQGKTKTRSVSREESSRGKSRSSSKKSGDSKAKKDDGEKDDVRQSSKSNKEHDSLPIKKAKLLSKQDRAMSAPSKQALTTSEGLKRGSSSPSPKSGIISKSAAVPVLYSSSRTGGRALSSSSATTTSKELSSMKGSADETQSTRKRSVGQPSSSLLKSKTVSRPSEPEDASSNPSVPVKYITIDMNDYLYVTPVSSTVSLTASSTASISEDDFDTMFSPEKDILAPCIEMFPPQLSHPPLTSPLFSRLSVCFSLMSFRRCF